MKQQEQKQQSVLEKDWEVGEYHCIVYFTPMGHRCGYVGVHKEHPLFGKTYNELMDIQCHGGLTFSDRIDKADDTRWYFGFDCAHCDDAKDVDAMKKYFDDECTDKILEVERMFPITGCVTRTLDYCGEQCEILAKELDEMGV